MTFDSPDIIHISKEYIHTHTRYDVNNSEGIKVAKNVYTCEASEQQQSDFDVYFHYFLYSSKIEIF